MLYVVLKPVASAVRCGTRRCRLRVGAWAVPRLRGPRHVVLPRVVAGTPPPVPHPADSPVPHYCPMILLLSCTSALVLTTFLYCLPTCRPAFRCARTCSSALGSFADCHVCRCHSRLAWLGLTWLGGYRAGAGPASGQRGPLDAHHDVLHRRYPLRQGTRHPPMKAWRRLTQPGHALPALLCTPPPPASADGVKALPDELWLMGSALRPRRDVVCRAGGSVRAAETWVP